MAIIFNRTVPKYPHSFFVSKRNAYFSASAGIILICVLGCRRLSYLGYGIVFFLIVAQHKIDMDELLDTNTESFSPCSISGLEVCDKDVILQTSFSSVQCNFAVRFRSRLEESHRTAA